MKTCWLCDGPLFDNDAVETSADPYRLDPGFAHPSCACFVAIEAKYTRAGDHDDYSRAIGEM